MNNKLVFGQQHQIHCYFLIKKKIFEKQNSIIDISIVNVLSKYLFKHVSIYSADLKEFILFFYICIFYGCCINPSIFLLNLLLHFFCSICLSKEKTRKKIFICIANERYIREGGYCVNDESSEENEREKMRRIP